VFPAKRPIRRIAGRKRFPHRFVHLEILGRPSLRRILGRRIASWRTFIHDTPNLPAADEMQRGQLYRVPEYYPINLE
jgi:hypothetical protein